MTVNPKSPLPLLLVACMAMTSCAAFSGQPVPDKADAATQAAKCPPSAEIDHGPVPAKPKGASVIAPVPNSPEAAATELFLQWVNALIVHANGGDVILDRVKTWCAGIG